MKYIKYLPIKLGYLQDVSITVKFLKYATHSECSVSSHFCTYKNYLVTHFFTA